MRDGSGSECEKVDLGFTEWLDICGELTIGQNYKYLA